MAPRCVLQVWFCRLTLLAASPRSPHGPHPRLAHQRGRLQGVPAAGELQARASAGEGPHACRQPAAQRTLRSCLHDPPPLRHAARIPLPHTCRGVSRQASCQASCDARVVRTSSPIRADALVTHQLPPTQRPTAETPYIRGLLDPCTNSRTDPNIPAEKLYDKTVRRQQLRGQCAALRLWLGAATFFFFCLHQIRAMMGRVCLCSGRESAAQEPRHEGQRRPHSAQQRQPLPPPSGRRPGCAQQLERIPHYPQPRVHQPGTPVNGISALARGLLPHDGPLTCICAPSAPPQICWRFVNRAVDEVMRAARTQEPSPLRAVRCTKGPKHFSTRMLPTLRIRCHQLPQPRCYVPAPWPCCTVAGGVGLRARCAAGVPQLNRHRLLSAPAALPASHAAPVRGPPCMLAAGLVALPSRNGHLAIQRARLRAILDSVLSSCVCSRVGVRSSSVRFKDYSKTPIGFGIVVRGPSRRAARMPA
jgi:hypothetical protein